MAEKKTLVIYAAAYETVAAALADLDAIEQLHKDEMIGQYDAAVIDKENGKPRSRPSLPANGSSGGCTSPHLALDGDLAKAEPALESCIRTQPNPSTARHVLHAETELAHRIARDDGAETAAVQRARAAVARAGTT